MRTRGDDEGILSQDHDSRKMAQIQGDGKRFELAMIHEAKGLTKLTKKLARKGLNDDAESDSLDSLICACGSSMPMRFSHAHDVPPRS
jgi:hypothetical protein